MTFFVKKVLEQGQHRLSQAHELGLVAFAFGRSTKRGGLIKCVAWRGSHLHVGSES